MPAERVDSKLNGWLKVASLVATLAIGAAILYSRLCVLETKVEMMMTRLGNIEQRLQDRNLLAPIARIDVDEEPVAR